MSNGHYDTSETQAYLMSPEMNPGLYDGTSSESSASSPMNCNAGFDSIYGPNGFMPYPAFSMSYPTHNEALAPVGLIPVELDIEGLYEDHDRRRKRSTGNEKVVASHVHSRRRAQNRASQRAFRDRKEKHMRELESRLSELEGRHSDLTRSYDSLQVEYSSVKEELERLKKETTQQKGSSSASSRTCPPKDWAESQREMVDPLLFDVSAFCYDQEESEERKQ